jgi:hypothetical protein
MRLLFDENLSPKLPNRLAVIYQNGQVVRLEPSENADKGRG